MERPTQPTIRILAVASEPVQTPDGVRVEHAADLAAAIERLGEGDVDVVLLPASGGPGAVDAVRERAPGVPVVAVVAPGEDPTAALEAGAHDWVPAHAEPDMLRRALRYATELARMQGELHRRQVVDEVTGLYNARGFEQLAVHHLRLADRSKEPVVLVFVRLEGLEVPGTAETARLLAETADVLREAVREADVAARIGAAAFCVLLTGKATGAEPVVLSRIVEAVASRNAGSARAVPLALSVGAATYDPAAPVGLGELLAEADRRMRPGAEG
jgi:two-component system, cell cycle response regulator